MKANKNFSVKVSILMAVFIVISLSGCFSEWNGGNATLTIYLGGGADRGTFTPAPEILERLTYVVDFSGPSTFTVGPTEEGKSTVSVSLFPGKWNITVTAYDGEKVYAIGKATVEARAGQNISKIITLSLEWVTFDTIKAFKTWLESQPNNTEITPYRVKLNVSSLGGSSNIAGDDDDPGSVGNVLNANANQSDGIYKYVKLDLSGSNLYTIDKEAFSQCHTLVGITIPDSVTKIEDTAFGGCRGLTSVIIPASVTVIEKGAFTACINLTSVTFQGMISEDGFNDIVYNPSFPGDLRDVYFKSGNGPGTYVREPDGTWTKQP